MDGEKMSEVGGKMVRRKNNERARRQYHKIENIKG
jgi:hypothetical protein